MEIQNQGFICDLIRVDSESNSSVITQIELPPDFLAEMNVRRETTEYNKTIFYMNVLERSGVKYIDSRIVSSPNQLRAIRSSENSRTDKVYELTKKSTWLILPKHAVKKIGFDQKVEVLFNQLNHLVFEIWPHGNYVPQETIEMPSGKKVTPGAESFVCVAPGIPGITYEHQIDNKT